MLVLQLLGTAFGTVAALLAAGCTFIIWNHPYAIIIFLLEGLITGLIYEKKRGDLVLVNATSTVTKCRTARFEKEERPFLMLVSQEITERKQMASCPGRERGAAAHLHQTQSHLCFH